MHPTSTYPSGKVAEPPTCSIVVGGIRNAHVPSKKHAPPRLLKNLLMPKTTSGITIKLPVHKPYTWDQDVENSDAASKSTKVKGEGT